MQATCQSAFQFAGVQRRPGDVLTAEDLALTSRTVIDALRGQGLILLDGDTPAGAQGPDYGLLLAKYEALSARIERAEQTHAEEIDALKAALSGAVDAAVLKAMEAFTGPSIVIEQTITPPTDETRLAAIAAQTVEQGLEAYRSKPGPKPKRGL